MIKFDLNFVKVSIQILSALTGILESKGFLVISSLILNLADLGDYGGQEKIFLDCCKKASEDTFKQITKQSSDSPNNRIHITRKMFIIDADQRYKIYEAISAYQKYNDGDKKLSSYEDIAVCAFLFIYDRMIRFEGVFNDPQMANTRGSRQDAVDTFTRIFREKIAATDSIAYAILSTQVSGLEEQFIELEKSINKPKSLTLNFLENVILPSDSSRDSQGHMIEFIFHKELFPNIEEAGLSFDGNLPKQQWTIISGEGGIGKTTTLKYLRNKYNTSHDSSLLPIYIPLGKCKTGIFPYIEEEYYIPYMNSRRTEKMDSNYFKKDLLSLLLEDSKHKFVFLLDGMNEVVREEETIKKDIEELSRIDNENIYGILTTRYLEGARGCLESEKPVEFKCNTLSEELVKGFLIEKEKLHEIININAKNNTELISFLNNPMRLLLFMHMYNPSTYHSKSADELPKKFKNISAFIEWCIHESLCKVRDDTQNDLFDYFSLGYFLPLIALEIKRRGISPNAIQGGVFLNILRDILNEIAKECEEIYDDEEIKRASKERKTDLQNTLTNLKMDERPSINLIRDLRFGEDYPILTIPESREKTIEWSHEIFFDWFAAKGMSIRQKYLPYTFYELLQHFTEKNIKAEVNIAPKFAIYAFCDFVYELIGTNICISEDKIVRPDNSDKTLNTQDFQIQYTRFLANLACAYDDFSSREKAYELSKIVLNMFDKYENELGGPGDEERYYYADMLNALAYTLTHVDDREKKKAAREVAAEKRMLSDQYIDKIKNPSITPDFEQAIKMLKSRLTGNLGAYYMDLGNEYQEKANSSFNNAIEQHKKAVNVRRSLLKDSDEEKKKLRFREIGQSYLGIATANHFLSQYDEAIKNHRLSIESRQKFSDDIFSNEIYKVLVRMAGSMNGAIKVDKSSTYAGSEAEKYFGEIFKNYIEAFAPIKAHNVIGELKWLGENARKSIELFTNCTFKCNSEPLKDFMNSVATEISYLFNTEVLPEPGKEEMNLYKMCQDAIAINEQK